MRIRFVNHASFVCEAGETQLICDPWLEGSAFNDGWDLISPTVFPTKGWEAIDYVWFSHEHPDHFSPRSLQAIPKEQRRRITVLYQQTSDDKVLKFCEKLGFATRVLPDHQDVRLSETLTVRCGRVPLFDSWLLLKSGAQSILNLNDCVVDGGTALGRLAGQVGKLDALFTQFSYAAWRGNREAKALRRRDAADKLKLLQKQVRAFAPATVVPFASFCFFSHEENFFTNDEANTPRRALDAIARTGARAALLYPGDEWSVGEKRDNRLALKRYEADYGTLSQRPRRRSPLVEVSEVQAAAAAFRQRVTEHNASYLLAPARRVPKFGLLQPLSVYVWDWGRRVRFTYERGVELEEGEPPDYSLKMASNSLLFLLKHPWGLDTLTVNGRFEADAEGLRRLVSTFGLDALNNAGLRLHPSLLLDVESVAFVARIVARKLWRLRKGQEPVPSQ